MTGPWCPLRLRASRLDGGVGRSFFSTWQRKAYFRKYQPDVESSRIAGQRDAITEYITCWVLSWSIMKFWTFSRLKLDPPHCTSRIHYYSRLSPIGQLLKDGCRRSEVSHILGYLVAHISHESVVIFQRPLLPTPTSVYPSASWRQQHSPELWWSILA
jgi:hypothetical protein